jgi:hypothetical protein
MIRYPEVFPGNKFYKLQLPKIKFVRRIDIVEENDINVLCEEMRRIERYDVLCAVELMEEHGFREGVFSTLKVDTRGNYRGISKEKEVSGKFTKEETEKILSSGVLSLRKTTLTNIVIKYTRKLFEKGYISCPFSCHDLRHYLFQKHFNTDSVRDFVELSKKFHKNLNTSIGYCHY